MGGVCSVCRDTDPADLLVPLLMCCVLLAPLLV